MCKLICKDCGEVMFRWKYVTLPVCNQCERQKHNMRQKLKLNGLKDEQLKNWVCDCYDGLGFVKSPDEYCCFTCLKINPNFEHKNKLILK